MMQQNGYLQVIDFGVAKVLQNGGTYKNNAGTPQYKAPEMRAYYENTETEELYANKADWWAVGIIAFEMLIGKHPFLHNMPQENFTFRKLIKTLPKNIRKPIEWPNDV